MIFSITEDMEKIKNVLCDPEIYERTSDDGSPELEDFNPIEPSEGVFYITDENNTGIVFIHWMNYLTVECHIQILKEHRNKSEEFGHSALKWIWDNTEAQKIVAKIPEIYLDVIRFTMKGGFRFEGICEKSYQKNGILYGVVNLGISR